MKTLILETPPNHQSQIKRLHMRHITFILLFLSSILNAQDPFITSWRTTTANDSITIPTYPGVTYNYDVDWGDGTITTGHTGNVTHTYAVADTYQVSISGNYSRLYFYNSLKVISIDQWGDQVWTDLSLSFFGCLNVYGLAVDTPNLSMVTNFNNMFAFARRFNQDISGWDVSNAVNMGGMFYLADAFNQDIGNWDVSNVENMKLMFWKAFRFNQDIDNWNVSNVKDMAGMFSEATDFNQDLDNWDVSNVESMKNMFFKAINFNGNISSWDVDSVTNMANMFDVASSFNQYIGDWDVSNVNDMFRMFAGAEVFNQDIGDWDVTGVNSQPGNLGMSAMFLAARDFNQDISEWDVSGVSNMLWMFRFADSFNIDIGDWDVSNVSNMTAMFQGAQSFNQDISDWNTESLQGAASMFADAVSFDQNIGSWDVSNVGDFSHMFTNVILSSCNYDAILEGWSTQQLIASRTFDAGLSQFYWAEAERQILLDTFGWIITDGGQDSLPPIAYCHDITIYLDANSGFATILPEEVDSFSFDTCRITNRQLSQSSFTCSDLGVNSIQLFVFDDFGNSDSCIAQITVIDTFSPLPSCKNANLYLDANGMAILLPTHADSNSSDNCNIVDYSFSQDTFICDHLGSNFVVMTISDESGNYSTCSAMVTVLDTISPSISCPFDITVSADIGSCERSIVNLGSPNTDDNCEIASVSNDAPSTYPIGITNVVWTATDGEGNISNCQQQVTVTDNEDPMISCPGTMVVSADAGLCSISNLNHGMATAIDNCGIDTIYSDAPDIFPLGSTLVTWTTVDEQGNSVTCNQEIIVVDEESPKAICNDVMLFLDDVGQSILVASEVDSFSFDNCGIDSMWLNESFFDCSHLGIQLGIFYVSDMAGNIDSCTFNLTVIDTINPQVVCQDISLNLDQHGMAQITVSQLFNGLLDNCGSTYFSLSQSEFDCSDIGTNNVRLYVTNDFGFIDSCEAVLTIDDPFGYCCPDVLVVNQSPIQDGTYSASMMVRSQKTVPANGSVIFRSGEQIELDSTFEVILGGVFSTLIDDCSD